MHRILLPFETSFLDANMKTGDHVKTTMNGKLNFSHVDGHIVKLLISWLHRSKYTAPDCLALVAILTFACKYGIKGAEDT